MSVLIKGMEMPTGYSALTLKVWHDGQVEIIDADGEWKTSEAVPVPAHGRLGDLDALMLKIREYIDEYCELDENGFHSEKWCAMKEAEIVICETPTVIPASEEAE